MGPAGPLSPRQSPVHSGQIRGSVGHPFTGENDNMFVGS